MSDTPKIEDKYEAWKIGLNFKLDKIDRLDDRLTELEEWTRCEEDRINNILKGLRDRINLITEKRKWPNKCPVCEGNGKGEKFTYEDYDNGNNGLVMTGYCKCLGCEGKGIVWG